MRFTFARTQDFWAGILFIGFGALALWIGSAYATGEAQRMGPGYFPRLLGWGLCGLGAMIALRGIVVGGAPVSRGAVRPFLALAGVVLFALLLNPAGLAIATLALVATSALAGSDFRLIEVIATAVTLIALGAVVFVWGLGLPLHLWPEW